MALIKCNECGNDVSSFADVCPHCGYPLEGRHITCSECGTYYEDNRDVCPECGCPRTVVLKKLKKKNYLKYLERLNIQNAFKIHQNILIFALICICVCSFVMMLALVLVNSITKKNNTSENAIVQDEGITKRTPDDDNIERQAIIELIEEFNVELHNGNFENTQRYLSEKYNYLDKVPYSISSEETLQSLFNKYNYEVKDVSVDEDGEKAFVVINVTHPVCTEILDAAISGWSMSDSSSMEKAVEAKINDSNLGIETSEASLNIIRIGEEWKISVDEYFFLFLFYGVSDELSFDKISDNEKKLMERERYIRENIELVDFLVEDCEGYSGKTLGIHNVSIKNNGDKVIDSFTLALDFLDEDGNVVETKEVVIIGYMDQSIEPGYSWKMQEDEFFAIENLSEDIDIYKVNVYIRDVILSEVAKSSVISEESKYINDYLELNDYTVKLYQSYNGIKPGIGNVSVKNNGERDIGRLTVTVFFQNEEGRNIAEDSFLVIGGLFGGDILKANYSWKMAMDKFYEIENLADEVDISRYTVEITEIEFE